MNSCETMVEKNMGLVGHIIRQYFYASVQAGVAEYDDLFQVGCIGLWDAAKDFDESRGVKFSTFAYQRIWSRIAKVFRVKKSMPPIALSLDMKCGENETSTLQEIIASHKDALDEIFAHMHFGRIFAQFNATTRRIIWLAYEGYNQHEIARTVGLAQATVSNRLKDIRNCVVRGEEPKPSLVEAI